MGIPKLGEPAASGRAVLLCYLSSSDIEGFPCLAIGPLLSGKEQGSVEMEDEVSHGKVLALVSPPCKTLTRVCHLVKSQEGQQSPEPAMQVSVEA